MTWPSWIPSLAGLARPDRDEGVTIWRATKRRRSALRAIVWTKPTADFATLSSRSYKQTAQQVLNACQPLAITFSVLLQPLCGAREEFLVDDGRHCHTDVPLSRCANLSVGPLWYSGMAARRMERRVPRQG